MSDWTLVYCASHGHYGNRACPGCAVAEKQVEIDALKAENYKLRRQHELALTYNTRRHGHYGTRPCCSCVEQVLNYSRTALGLPRFGAGDFDIFLGPGKVTIRHADGRETILGTVTDLKVDYGFIDEAVAYCTGTGYAKLFDRKPCPEVAPHPERPKWDKLFGLQRKPKTNPAAKGRPVLEDFEKYEDFQDALEKWIDQCETFRPEGN